MPEFRDIASRVHDDLAERLSGKSGSADDLRSEIERLDSDFDFDSHYPYSSQESELINELEVEYWREAQDLADCGQEFRPSQWEQARRSYAAALAFTAYSSLWEQAKTELTEVIEKFECECIDAGCESPVISLSLSCAHGWASHDRETQDGTMLWISRRLDGCNGLAREISGLWLSVCFDLREAQQ